MVATTRFYDMDSFREWIQLSGFGIHNETHGGWLDSDPRTEIDDYDTLEDIEIPRTISTAQTLRIELERGGTWEGLIRSITGAMVNPNEREDVTDEDSAIFDALEKEALEHLSEILQGNYPRFRLVSAEADTRICYISLDFACADRDDCYFHVYFRTSKKLNPEIRGLKLAVVGPKDASGFEPRLRFITTSDYYKVIAHLSPSHRRSYIHGWGHDRIAIRDYTNF